MTVLEKEEAKAATLVSKESLKLLRCILTMQDPQQL